MKNPQKQEANGVFREQLPHPSTLARTGLVFSETAGFFVLLASVIPGFHLL